jgi:hypothetical protein
MMHIIHVHAGIEYIYTYMGALIRALWYIHVANKRDCFVRLETILSYFPSLFACSFTVVSCLHIFLN